MDGKRRPGDIGGPPTDEIGNGRADITFGIAQGPQGDASDQTLLQPRVVLQRCLNRRRARERDDGVHPDAVFGPLDGGGTTETLDGSLGGGICALTIVKRNLRYLSSPR